MTRVLSTVRITPAADGPCTFPAANRRAPLPDGRWSGAGATAGAFIAAYRIRTRPRTGYDGLLLETAVGQVPVDLIRQWLRGPDVLVAAGLVLALVL